MFNLNSLELLAYGGSPIAPTVVRDVRKLLPKVKLLQVYGLSEAGFLTGLTDAEHTDDRLQSCGRPCPGIDLRIVDAAGKPVASGELGNLAARGPGVMLGYWHEPKATAAAPAPVTAGTKAAPARAPASVELVSP